MSSRKQSHSPCEGLRAQALQDGPGSVSDRQWRRHAEQCRECQASVRLVEMLYQDSRLSSGGVSLDASRLVEMARRRYARKSSWLSRVGRGAVRCAALAVIFLFTALLSPLDWSGQRLARSLAGLESRQPVSGHEQVVPLAQPESDLSRLDFEQSLLDSQDIQLEQAIQETRTHLHSQIEDMNALIDRDLTAY